MALEAYFAAPRKPTSIQRSAIQNMSHSLYASRLAPPGAGAGQQHPAVASRHQQPQVAPIGHNGLDVSTTGHQGTRPAPSPVLRQTSEGRIEGIHETIHDFHRAMDINEALSGLLRAADKFLGLNALNEGRTKDARILRLITEVNSALKERILLSEGPSPVEEPCQTSSQLPALETRVFQHRSDSEYGVFSKSQEGNHLARAMALSASIRPDDQPATATAFPPPCAICFEPATEAVWTACVHGFCR